VIRGQKVVCVNDTFGAFVKAVYRQLPEKGRTYTIREVFLGRERIVQGGDSATVGLLLEELVNPPDPFHVGKQELGFSSERFAPLEELPPAEAEVGEEAGIGAGSPGTWENGPGGQSSVTRTVTAHVAAGTASATPGRTSTNRRRLLPVLST
jgi:hypothetical protein